MAYDRQFLNIEWLFEVTGGLEIAATGLRVTGPNTLFPAATALGLLTPAQGQALITAYIQQFTAVGVRWAEYSNLIGIKVSAVGVDGKYLTDPRVFTAPANTKGNQGAVLPQSTVCVSLRSGSSFGKANYGRAYLPHTLMPIAAGTPYADDPAVIGAKNGALEWVNQVNTVAKAIDPGYRVHIMSNGSTGPGAAKPVTRVGVGDVIDTQRRRRNNLKETYSFGNVF